MGELLKLRVFLALPLAGVFAAEVSPLILELKQKHPGIRWVPASEIHATLHFFGAIKKDDIPGISELITPLTKAARPFHLRLEGLGAFPNAARPRVVWIGIRGETAPLVELRSRIEARLKENGYACEKREFRPHATIGRIKEGLGGRGFETIKFGPTSSKIVEELILFQSHPAPQGAHYEAIATYPLAAA